MVRALHDLFVEVTTTAAAVVALTLAGFGFQEATKPTLAWSGSRRERHLIGCPVCRDHSLPAAEQLRRCPRLADLQRQLRDRPYPEAEEGHATAVAGRRLTSDPGAE